MARQGVGYPTAAGLMVADPATLKPVPRDGATMGEIMLRGNTVMKGYLKNPNATDSAFSGGWFHTGDLAVWHPDGYVEIKDRSKDIIISGGENISSLEIEEALYKHPAVMEAAVVARPDPRWGETPCAFVTLKPGASATAEEIVGFLREAIARFKVPRHVRVRTAAQDVHRQDPEVRAPRTGPGDRLSDARHDPGALVPTPRARHRRRHRGAGGRDHVHGDGLHHLRESDRPRLRRRARARGQGPAVRAHAHGHLSHGRPAVHRDGTFANYPFALAPGMGLNAVVAFELVAGRGLTWPQAMTIVVFEGLIITLLVLTRFREAMLEAVPIGLKRAISLGIGLFIAFIGFFTAGFVVKPATGPLPVALGPLDGLPSVVFVVGFVLSAWLMARRCARRPAPRHRADDRPGHRPQRRAGRLEGASRRSAPPRCPRPSCSGRTSRPSAGSTSA
jgi:hypothetical protein